MNKLDKQMRYEFVDEPCRNFNILGSTTIMDPKDGREKIVLSNFAAGATGNVIFIDSLTGEGEAIRLPGDNGAWATLNLNNDKLLIGTCAQSGYLHCLDLKSRIWAEPLRDEHETYIWNLTLGSDGMVYGGTYPGCSLLRYDPERHVLENMGKVSDSSQNLYSRQVTGELPGYILILGGFDTPFLTAWNMETREFKPFGNPDTVGSFKEVNDEFICVSGKNEGELYYYDSRTFEPIQNRSLDNQVAASKGLKLKDGRIGGVRGQDYFILNKEGDKPLYQRIPTPAPATHIHTIISDAHGNIWGACGFGQTIFCYRPEEKSYWNSSVICNNGGEVYGMSFVGNQLYMSAYSGGDHVVYNIDNPWNQLDNVNPVTLQAVAPDLIRPTGRTLIGPDGGVWTGWSAKYGTYGGGLSRIDVYSQEVASWYDPIPCQQVAGLAADNRYLYFTTNGGASGLPYNKEVICHFAVWSTDGRLVYKQAFAEGIKLDAVLAVGGRVLVKTGDAIQIFDPGSMSFAQTVSVGEACSWMIKVDDEHAAAFCGRHVYSINSRTGDCKLLSELPGEAGTAAITPKGDIYFAYGTALYKLTQ
ncbi:hypothetical protein ACFPYJ_03485 [Paenibacillus solisilvae]|uniref:WD40 repeat domain-containing protein n=1 Tax=Paenibacillus solisilvae TaxID=2486751 RepID=A0ABW0VVJ5_9BACL